MLRALALAVLCAAAAARAQQCSIRLSCPGSGGGACSGSECNGEVTYSWSASCDRGGNMTSCVISASSGQSCSCQGTGSCSLGTITCPCHDMCGGQCLDGSNFKCCNGQAVQGDAVCCPDGHLCAAGAVCCADGCIPEGKVCCAGGGFCEPGTECCSNGVRRCVPPGSSCCEDGVHYCAKGSDCVSNHCCPRLTTESSAFTAYDGTTGYCCGDMSCASTGGCQGGAGVCACANPCNGSCCPSGTSCCAHKGWCAPSSMGCPTCPPGYPVDCLDGTCAEAGGICCGKGLFCPNGLSCVDTGGGKFGCGGGAGGETTPATSTRMPAMPPGSDAGHSLAASMSSGPATQSSSAAGMPSGPSMGGTAPGCGGGSSPGGSNNKLGAGYPCGCIGGGSGVEFLAVLLMLRRAAAGRAAPPRRDRGG